ncbi:hypothetical protein [Pedobacter cryoconitis]|uniref:Uncharacterized protein n=1 Tax=Pedobacter cryoconitis TaxID=188932 RepID=A0A7X0J8U6_9SPHI|nr:hypothetical protein [Pedobacter cryoconitis]MBB6502905.1 hypothetical protein [Pedobacter cryoconitis]
MVKIDSIQKNIEEIKEIGLENIELMPQVEKWCVHLTVQGYARGMVAEMYRIPNNVKLDCQHAAFPADWLRLSVIAEEFIAQNCINCNFHQARSKPNYGEVILEKLQKQTEEQSEREKLRTDLAEKIKQETNVLIAAGRFKANPTQLSILKMLVGLADESQRSITASKLSAAALLDPSFFSDDALNVLLMYFEDEQAGAYCIEAACAVMAGRKYFPVNLLDVAKAQTGTSPHFDRLAKILNFYIEVNNIDDHILTIDTLITRLWYKRHIGEPANPERNFQNAEALLIRLAKVAPEQLQTIFRQHLAVNEKNTRINIDLLLQRLTATLPEFVAALAPEIIRSLEFTDNQYEESADGVTLETIQVLFNQDPPSTFACLTKEKVKLSVAAKALFPRLTINLLNNRAFADNHPEITTTLVDELVADILNSGVPEEVQTAARHQLSYFIQQRPELFQSRFDGFLGYLSKVAEEEALFKFYEEELENKEPDERTTFNYLVGKNFYEVKNIEQEIHNRYQETKKIIGELCKVAPHQNLPKVYSIIPEISSAKNEKYKKELIKIVTDYGKDPAMLAGFIPQLYTHLLDPDSKNIRHTALLFLNKIFEKFQMLLTTSLWDLFNVFLEDKEPGIKGLALMILGTVADNYPERITAAYLKIHKDALYTNWAFVINNAIEISNNLRPFMSERERYEMTVLLVRIADIYSKEDDDTKLSGVVDQILSFVADQPEALYKIPANFISPRVKTGDYYQAKEQLEKLWYLAKKAPEVYSLWLDGVLSFLIRFPYNGGGGQDDRLDFYFKMHHLDRKFIVAQEAQFRELFALPGTAIERHFEVAHILAILGYFECYTLLEEVTVSLKLKFTDVEANKRVRRNIEFWQLMAAVEITADRSEKLNKLKIAANVFKA